MLQRDKNKKENKFKVYLAGPFFNVEQLKLVGELEDALVEEFVGSENGLDVFSPRLADNAVAMNEMIRNKVVPPMDLRSKVFGDNVDNIDDSDLMVAIIDDHDSGTIWEIGYAFRAHVPVITFTGRNFGSNLMLAQSTIGHLKSVADLRGAIRIANPRLSRQSPESIFGEAMAEIQSRFKTADALKETHSTDKAYIEKMKAKL